MSSKSSATSSGIGFGSALAMIISYDLNGSIGWAIFHGILGWLYVIYQWILALQQPPVNEVLMETLLMIAAIVILGGLWLWYAQRSVK